MKITEYNQTNYLSTGDSFIIASQDETTNYKIYAKDMLSGMVFPSNPVQKTGIGLEYFDYDVFARLQMAGKSFTKSANSEALRDFRMYCATGTGPINILKFGDGYVTQGNPQGNFYGLFAKVCTNFIDIYGTGGVGYGNFPFIQASNGGVEIDNISSSSVFIRSYLALSTNDAVVLAPNNSSVSFPVDTFKLIYVTNTGAGTMAIDTGVYGGSYARYTGFLVSGSTFTPKTLEIQYSTPVKLQVRISGSGDVYSRSLILPEIAFYNRNNPSGRAVIYVYANDSGPSYQNAFTFYPGTQRDLLFSHYISGINPHIVLFENAPTSNATEVSGLNRFLSTFRQRWPSIPFVFCATFPHWGTTVEYLEAQRPVVMANNCCYFDGFRPFVSHAAFTGRGFINSSDPSHPTISGYTAYSNFLWDYLDLQ